MTGHTPQKRGWRTVFLIVFIGGPVVIAAVWMMATHQVESADVAGIIRAVAELVAVGAIGYGASKVATGMRATRLAEAERIKGQNNPPDSPGG